MSELDTQELEIMLTIQGWIMSLSGLALAPEPGHVGKLNATQIVFKVFSC